jgi:hypothetical protein
MSAEVMFNRETHKSRGFGFIVFEHERSAELVCAEIENVIDGKVVSTADDISDPTSFVMIIGGGEASSAEVAHVIARLIDQLEL